MARLPELVRFCKKHCLKMITVADLARFRWECDEQDALHAIEGMFPVCSCKAMAATSGTLATTSSCAREVAWI
jgi:hypothetical protein